MKQTLLFLLVFSLGIIFGVAIMFLVNKTEKNREQSEKPQIQRMNSQYAYTNPLLECEVYPKINGTLTPFEDKLDRYIESVVSNGRVSDVSVYYRDLVNGPWIGINEDKKFSPASLLKVPLMMSILHMADEDPTLLAQELPFQKEQDNNRAQIIPPEVTLEVGKNYSINQLLEHMIIYSDNDAANVLALSIPQAEFFRPYNELGLPAPRMKAGEYFVTVVDYASFFRVLYNSTYLGREDSERALSLLATTAFKNGLVAGVPDNVRVSHKFGERQWEGSDEQQLHDCGIIYHPVRPYVLCIMTKGKDTERLVEVTKNISKISYDEVDSQTK